MGYNVGVQALPHGGYNPGAVAYNGGRRGAEEEEEDDDDDDDEEGEDEEQDPYQHGYPPQYYPGYDPRGYRPGPRSEDVELRSPGVAQRFARHARGTGEEVGGGGGGDAVVTEESEEGGGA
ncbi:heterogeneous nuclear ribonucleoprotein U-like protein 2 [Gadus macrocephalus]|uniref:heterogeneous nuclear ribonucleoprotein U-like protein 2 n=1 Tax=Gadus macrocephalus TaxID=80720 RepID=UPI0028CBABA3|nr:heterogeneous nuclear ribonucleoprotein U-like protein 2 [Gadus macrocephalus]